MTNTFILIKYCIYFFVSVFLLGGCASAPDRAAHKSYTIEIKEMKFEPAELIVQKGDTVVWINRDMVAHDATEEPTKAWTSGVIPSGQSWSLVVTKSADYYCSIHVVMKGKLLAE